MPFQPDVHADSAGYSPTQKTRTCFAEDIESYIFSVSYGIAGLEQYISNKLCSYPVYAPEIVKLIGKLYSPDNKAKPRVEQELARFIADRIRCFRHALIADDRLLTALRICFPPKTELEFLSRHDNIDPNTVDTALRALRDGIGEQNTAAAMLQVFERKHLNSNIEFGSSAATMRPAHARRTSENPLSNHAADAMITLNTIRDGRVVRAEQSASGTLCSTRRGSAPATVRNEDFRVASGQHLVVLPGQRPQVQGVTVRVVCNQEGEIGELLSSLKLTPIRDVDGK